MITVRQARRIVIVIDAGLRDGFLEKLMELGATGYNWSDCAGKGIHAITGGPFAHEGLSRIETVVTEPVATAIMDHIHASQFGQYGQYALTAYMDTVEVDARDKSFS